MANLWNNSSVWLWFFFFFSHPDPIVLRPVLMTHGLLYFVTWFDSYNINCFFIAFRFIKLFWSCLCCRVLVKCCFCLVQVCTFVFVSFCVCWCGVCLAKGVWLLFNFIPLFACVFYKNNFCILIVVLLMMSF